MTNCALRARTTEVDHSRSLILVIELSSGTGSSLFSYQKHTKQQIAPQASALMAMIKSCQRRAGANAMSADRIIVTYEAGGDGFWLAR